MRNSYNRLTLIKNLAAIYEIGVKNLKFQNYNHSEVDS